MNKTEKILEEFDSEIKPMIENEVLCRYQTSLLAQDSADTLNKQIRQFIAKSIQQAVAEERARVVELVKTSKVPYMFPVTESRFLHDLLTSLDKEINNTNKE